MSDPFASVVSQVEPRRLLVRCLAASGAIWLSLHGVVWILSNTKGYWAPEHAAASFPSPDGRFKAVVFLSIGGGPAASYCGTSVYVVPVTRAEADSQEGANLVYSGNCGGMSEGHWDKNLIWRGPDLLEIGFNPTMGAIEGGLTIRSHAAGGEVRVIFSFQSTEDSWSIETSWG
jgi:hypothetical protein